MITDKARSNGARRLLANVALVGVTMTAPMMAVTAPATAMPTLGPGVAQTDCDFDYGLDFDYGYSNQWIDASKPWKFHGNPWKFHGNPWNGFGNQGCGFGNLWLFPPGWFGSS
ncbi:hypothetical protein [Nocardia sp. NPDC052112]|uniref:hypothetical protein n=1 Tax=Nocardia sp. NPDC052112 TaxID=3155646 RepID=UPI00343FB0BC